MRGQSSIMRDHTLKLVHTEKMSNHGHRTWYEDREEWEQNRALYELELQSAYTESSNRRIRWLAGAFIGHVITIMLLEGGEALLGFSLAAASGTMLLYIHTIENKAARIEMSQKLEMMFPEKLTPRPPEED